MIVTISLPFRITCYSIICLLVLSSDQWLEFQRHQGNSESSVRPVMCSCLTEELKFSGSKGKNVRAVFLCHWAEVQSNIPSLFSGRAFEVEVSDNVVSNKMCHEFPYCISETLLYCKYNILQILVQGQLTIFDFVYWNLLLVS